MATDKNDILHRPSKGPFKNDVTGVGERRVAPKISDKNDKGRKGYMQIVSSPPKKIMLLFFACVWSPRQQLRFD